ncbi:LacI family DNA-binding transcriptional regulator [Velocimicrobium porci]|uniref:LacI family transcriptional regulator n=1 Tax=Velocimicrobium porci TaxID=2606634 RepID=A0A6L5XU70_9FIRM|nr:LacI family DNA-binding transcriptional regulator [Velocimicrobium porci]MSS62315.1 LacI family transcriptional regulator [Velocimicrobium porci]
MKVSIRDISAMTGYSPATVSNALNHKKGVNKETSAKIFQVAKEVGYINESSITKIKLVIFHKNGLIVEDTPFFPSLINGFEQECRQYGYEMVIYNVDQRDADYEKQVNSLITEAGSAIVILATEMLDGDLEIYKKATCPIVVLDYWTESMEFNAVLINNADSARMATEYLIDRGHREIGYIRGNYRIKGFRSRFAGFQIALRKHRIKFNDEYVYTVKTTLNGAYQDMVGYLKKNPKLPTAFFVDNDLMALGAMKAFQEQGYRIPEDISIVGFDDLPFSEISSPRLSTVRVPNTEMGKIAVRRLVELIEKRDTIVTKTQVCTQFIERDTVKKLKN